jgi:4-hydroxy-2-oxoheptanedioate aldolase
MKRNKLRAAMREGRPIAGMVAFTRSPAVVEVIGYSGFDFIFIDTEHTPLASGADLEHMILAADAAGLSVVVRLKGNDENQIRNALECGAEGVIIPRLKTRAEAEQALSAARFPPLGERGSATEVRAASYGTGDFDWVEYVKRCNEDTVVIGLAEDKVFFDNIDDIMSVDGLDMICFGPTDLAMSLGLPLVYDMEAPPIQEAFQTLLAKARQYNTSVMSLVIPPTLEEARKLYEQGVNAVLLRSDIGILQATCRQIMDEVVKPLRAGA